MGTIADKLNELKRTKDNIKAAIISKGVNVADNTPFSSYPNKIAEIETGGIATPRVTAKYAYHKNNPETNLTQEEIDRYVFVAEGMFSNCNSQRIYAIDGKKLIIVNPVKMFYYCQLLKSLDVSKFDTSAVTNMNNMFYYCKALKSLDLSNWDTSNVTDLGSMFYYCQALASLDLSNWNTSNVTNLGSMFNGCSSLTSLDLSNWDTSNVTSLSYTFYNCAKLKEIDLSTLNLIKCDNIYYAFGYCSELLKLRLPDIPKSSSSSIQMFNVVCSKCNDFQFANGGTFGNKSTSSSLTLSLVYIWRGSADAIATGHDKTNGYFYEAFANSIGENTSGKTRNIKLYTTLYNSLTDEQKALLTDKGYTLSYGTS